jgi:hypothetical protein
MIISLKRVIQFIQLWVLIIISTVVLYQILQLVHAYLWQVDLYRPPQGQSLKVHASPQHGTTEPWYFEDINRIKVFFLTGE